MTSPEGGGFLGGADGFFGSVGETGFGWGNRENSLGKISKFSIFWCFQFGKRRKFCLPRPPPKPESGAAEERTRIEVSVFTPPKILFCYFGKKLFKFFSVFFPFFFSYFGNFPQFFPFFPVLEIFPIFSPFFFIFGNFPDICSIFLYFSLLYYFVFKQQTLAAPLPAPLTVERIREVEI